MSLLRAHVLQQATAGVAARRSRRATTLQKALFGADGKQVPAGFVRLETPEERHVATRFLARKALQEQEGFAPGDAYTRAISTPSVQQAVQVPNG